MPSSAPDAQPSDQPAANAWALLAIGLAAGAFGSFFGLGGGIVFVPLLIYALRRPTHEATVTSLAVMPFLTLTSVITALLANQGDMEAAHVSWRHALTLGTAAVVGSSLVGVPLAPRVPAVALRRLFAVVVFATAVEMVTHPTAGVEESGSETWGLWTALPCGLVIGTLSGLLGVGGGIVPVPLLVLAYGIGQHDAHLTSLAMILPASVAGTLRAQGQPEGLRPNWRLTLALTPGVIVGAASGVGLAGLIPAPTLKLLFAILIFAFGIRMLDLGAAVRSWRSRRAGDGRQQA